jgi:cell division protein FtsI (penicillin-binding protein 3)
MSGLVGERGRWIRVRMGVLCGLLAVGLGLIASSAWDIMGSDGAIWRETAERQRQRRLHFPPKRGTIYDRNGSPLAVSIDVPSVSLDAAELLRTVAKADVAAVSARAASRIAQALSLDVEDVRQKILSRRRFVWLKHRITTEEADRVRLLTSDKAPESELVRGLAVDGEGQRFYPRRELGAQLLGIVSPYGRGLEGLELSLDKDLEGHVEQLRGLRDRSGRLLFADGIQDDQALAGHDVYLTIDQGIQYVAERELGLAVRTFEAAAGSVVVVEPETGEVLATASWPSFNPNDFRTSSAEARRTRDVSIVFEPGSTMKIFTVAAGLAGGAISMTQKLYCEKGVMAVDNVMIRDTHPSEWLSLPQVLALSSNVCAAKIGLSLGGDKLYEALRRFGFGQETGVPLPGESSGTLRPRGRPWVQVETASASFGQGISVTNLQMAMAVAAVANGGNLLEPTVIKRVTTANGEVVREAVPRIRHRVIPERVARAVAEMMVGVTEGAGTGTEANVEGYRVAGKTATAQKTDPQTGRYSLDRYTASFVGFVPADKPVIAVSVMIDEPMVEHAGGAVAAPVFRRLAEMVLAERGLTPDPTKPADLAVLARSADPAAAAVELIREAEGKKPPVQEVAPPSGRPARDHVRVPDMTGWPLREAVNAAWALGVQPRVTGTGLLARQVPSPGRDLAKGAELLLVFEPAT